MANVQKWSKTTANNATADSDINWAEGQAPSTVNNSARAVMQGLANWRDDTAGQLTLAGGTTVYTLTTNSVNTAQADGFRVHAVVNVANTGASTLNVDGLGAKNIYKAGTGGLTTLSAGDLVVDMHAIFEYDASLNAAAGGWVLLNPFPAQSVAIAYVGATSAGSANAQTVAASGFALTTGNRITFVAGFSNTGALTLNVNSTGVKNVFRLTPGGAVACVGGEVVAGQVVDAVYDGTQFQLMESAAFETGAVTSIASAATTDLGTIASRNASITGTTTITSFGSSAIVSLPLYFVTFTGILTLTHNATSLICPGGANITTAAGDSAVLMYLGSGNWRVLNYQRASGLAVIGGAQVLDTQTFTANGTWTKPATGTWLLLEGVGSGAGGGGGGSNGTGGAGGGGGGAGVVGWYLLRLADLAATETVVVPAGGTGGATATNGGAGSDASFGSWAVFRGGAAGGGATGGTPGVAGDGGSGGGGGGNSGSGGVGGNGGATGNAGTAGGAGGAGGGNGARSNSIIAAVPRIAQPGGGGGGGGRTGTTTVAAGGTGGAATSWLGAGGAGGAAVNGTGAAGSNATGPGGGGGGGGAGVTGGAGGNGFRGEIRAYVF